jgi:hypothetical protein
MMPGHEQGKRMPKQAPTIEGQLAASDADWERLNGPPALDRVAIADRHSLLQCYLWRMAALLLLLVQWRWRTAAH